MPKVKHVKAQKDYPQHGVKKGEMCYVWSLKTGPRTSQSFRQKAPPTRAQLTTSEFLQQAYSIQDDLEKIESLDDLDDIIQAIQDLETETQDKLDGMPEGLQSGPTGELLQERIENLNSWASDLESLKDNPPEKSEDQSDEAYAEAVNEHLEEIRSTQGDF